MQSNLWQSAEWEAFQKTLERKVWRVEVPGASALLIRHDLPLGLCWLEAPRGPVFSSEKALKALLLKLKILGNHENAVFLRFSPFHALPQYPSLRPARRDHQPQTTLALDLSLSEEALLKQMKPKGRYNISLAQKHGVTVEPSHEVGAFYGLLQKTANRDGFGVHPQSYYQRMLETLEDTAQLFLARWNGQIIAGGIFVYHEGTALYYYGASDHAHRDKMAPYLVQWEAIKEGQRRHCKTYDFLGIAPEDATHHPWAGVTDFKKKFGGHVIHYPQAQELTLKPFWHWAYLTTSRLR